LLLSGIALIAVGNLAAQSALAEQGVRQSAIKMTVNSNDAKPAVEQTEAVASFTLTSTPTTLTIPYGSTGVETFTLTPVNNYLGIVNLSATVPALVSTNSQGCLAGTTVVGDGVSVSQTINATLTIYTYPATCPIEIGSLQKAPATGSQSPADHSTPVRASLAIAGLLLAGLMGRGARKLRGLAGLIVLVTLGLTISGCGGGSSSSTSKNLPKGSYPITITGTDALTPSLTSSTTFTLVVD